MQMSERSGPSEAPSYSDWAPILLRFFQLCVGDQAAAENLTIETLVEGAHLGGVRLSMGIPVALVRHAVDKARKTSEPNSILRDSLVRAVTSLPLSQRMVVVLFRGLGIPLDEVAAVTGISLRQARHICADGLVAIHRFLTALDTKHD